MFETTIELTLKDITRRLGLLLDQVSQGELVDTTLLVKLNEVSEECYIKHSAGYDITEEELTYMIELIDLLEMRTTLFYKN